MKNRKILSSVLFFVALVISGFLVFSCSRTKKELPRTPNNPAFLQSDSSPLPIPLAQKQDQLVSFDFDSAQLSTVIPFVTESTGLGFILDNTQQILISWTEFNIPRDKILDSFSTVLRASGLSLNPTNDEKKTFIIEKLEESEVPYQLQYASSKHGTFFLFNNTIYSKDQFPHPVHFQDGHWFTIIPKSLAEKENISQAGAVRPAG